MGFLIFFWLDFLFFFFDTFLSGIWVVCEQSACWMMSYMGGEVSSGGVQEGRWSRGVAIESEGGISRGRKRLVLTPSTPPLVNRAVFILFPDWTDGEVPKWDEFKVRKRNQAEEEGTLSPLPCLLWSIVWFLIHILDWILIGLWFFILILKRFRVEVEWCMINPFADWTALGVVKWIWVTFGKKGWGRAIERELWRSRGRERLNLTT